MNLRLLFRFNTLFSKGLRDKKTQQHVAAREKSFNDIESSFSVSSQEIFVGANQDPNAFMSELRMKYYANDTSISRRTHNKEFKYEDNPIFMENLSMENRFTKGLISFQDAKYSEAIATFRHCLKFQSRVSGENSLKLAALHDYLGLACINIAEFQEALKHFNKALIIRQFCLKHDDPKVATSFKDIASVYKYLGKFKEAEDFLLKALRIESTNSAYDEILSTYCQLADVQLLQGQFDKAFETCQKVNQSPFYNETTQRQEQAFFEFVLGNVYLYRKEYENASSFLEKARDSYLHLNVNQSNGLAKVYVALGLLKKELKDFEESVVYLNKGLEIQRQIYSELHPEIGLTFGHFGKLAFENGQLDEAISFFKKGLIHWTSIFGEKHEFIGTLYHDLGLVYSDLGDHNKAMKYYKYSLQVRQNMLGVHEKTIASLYNIAMTYSYMDQHTGALQAYLECLEMSEKLSLSNNVDIADLYCYIGKAYSNLQQTQNSIDFFNRELILKRELYGELHPEVALCYKNIGDAHSKENKWEKSVDYFRKSLQVTFNVAGLKNFQAQHTLCLLRNAYKTLGYSEEEANSFIQLIIKTE